MQSTDKIHMFQERLLAWFQVNQRSFPWRKATLTPYQIVISEVLLQRTKAETVAKFYDSFLLAYPNWSDLANSLLENLQDFLKPVGLYRQRAKRIKSLAAYMVENDGVFPTDRVALEEVPFMGQYIANAVELFIHNKNSPLLDVNMARVLERYFGPRKMADIRYDPYLQKLASSVARHSSSKEINWAILDFAAKICRAKNPLCNICPLQAECTTSIDTH